MNREDEIDKMIEDEISAGFDESGESDNANNAEVFENIEKADTENLDIQNSDVQNSDTESSDDDIDFEDDSNIIEWIYGNAADSQDSAKQKQKKKKSKMSVIIYNIIRYAVMCVALVVFGYAAYQLTLIYVESREAEDLKSKTSEMFLVDLDDLQENYEVPTNSDGETISLDNENDGQIFVFDYQKMLEYNSHAKGYIRQDNGEYIDNPILQHPTDNEYYLTHLVDHTKSSIGSIYIDSSIEDGLNAKNCIIYGHNIGQRAGKIMFGSLNWYWSETGYYKEHPTFDIWIEDTHYKYYVFAIYKTEAVGSSVYQYAFSSDEEFMEYVAMCKKNSKYTFKEAPEITADSHIITLSTCTHTDEMRMIVQLVRGEELDIYGNPVGAESAE